MYLGVHYPSDIVAGMVYGAAAGYLMFRATIVVNRVHLDFPWCPGRSSDSCRVWR